MAGINYVVLDVLKPHKPSILEVGKELLKLGNGLSVNLRISEIDEKTETIQIIVKGKNINIEKIRKIVEKMSGSVHSIDEVSLGKCVINSKDYLKIH
ncbi:DUF211 domain-containing protein [candidate division KSB1 bacterium]